MTGERISAEGLASDFVLLVEDDPDSAEIMVEVLARAGYAVHLASDGREALTWLAAHRPTVIVLDLHMPGIDGLEVLNRLRADPNRADVPVIVLSAVPRQLAAVGEVAAFLAKPCDPFEVPRIIRRLVGGASQPDPLPSAKRA